MEETMKKSLNWPNSIPSVYSFSCTVRMALVKSADLLEPELLKRTFRRCWTLADGFFPGCGGVEAPL